MSDLIKAYEDQLNYFRGLLDGKDAEIKRIRVKIEELEAYQREVNELWGGVHFTIGQISSAMERMTRLIRRENTAEHFMGMGISATLKQDFRIKICEGCGGSGESMPSQTTCPVTFDPTDPIPGPCPECAPWGSNGWVIR